MDYEALYNELREAVVIYIANESTFDEKVDAYAIINEHFTKRALMAELAYLDDLPLEEERADWDAELDDYLATMDDASGRAQ